MQDFKKEVKQWLKNSGKDRFWLAKQCYVGKNQVDKWFSTAEIPESKKALIKKLMSETSDEKKDQATPPLTLPDMDERGKIFLRFTEEEQEEVYKEATRLNIEPSSYCTAAVKWCCEQEDIGNIIKRLIEKEDQRKREKIDKPIPSREQIAKILALKKQHEEIIAGLMRYEISHMGNIAAGGLMEGDGEKKVLTTSKKYPKDAYVLRVCGSSMEPNIPNDSLIVVRPWKYSYPPKSGKIVVYWDGRGVTLKKLQYEGDEPLLVSINPQYPAIHPIEGEGSISAVYVGILK